MKRVLFVATVVKGHINAFHLPCLKWFQEQGYEVHVCAKDDYAPAPCQIPYCDAYYDVPFARNPFQRTNIKAYKRLKQIVQSNRYDIIHCHTPMGGALGRLAACGVRREGTKVFYTAHGFHFYKGAPPVNWLLYYPVERFLAHFTDVLITINKEDYKRAKGFQAKRVEYAPGVGVDLSTFYPDTSKRQQKRRELGIEDGTLALLSIGELSKRKNHGCVIRALAQERQLDFQYLICGEGPLRGELIGLTQEMGLQGKVRLLGYRKDVADLCQAADIFLFPSLQEGLPVALMEAMACALPCVASQIRGNVDLIEDGVNGQLISPKDGRGFIDAAARVWKHADDGSRMGIAAMRTVQDYSLDRVLKCMSEIYLSELVAVTKT